MRSHIFRHQTFITVSLFTILIFLIAFQVTMPEQDLDGQFSLIAGWLGIVIGFFFNQQITAFFIQRWKQSQREKEKIEEKAKATMEGYEKAYEQLKEKAKQIEETTNNRQKKT